MAIWNDSGSVDELVRASDRTLNMLLVVMFAAFAFGSGAYYYGQMNPRVPAQSDITPVTPDSPPG